MAAGKISGSLVGKAGELLVAAELMRRGVEVATPASDVGVDLLAYRLRDGQKTGSVFVPIQVKTYSGTGYRFLKTWFDRAPGLVLVSVWHVVETPVFYVFRNLVDVVAAMGAHAQSDSWKERGIWSATTPSASDFGQMAEHRKRWDRITDQLWPTSSA